MLAVMVSAVVGAVAAPRAFDACGQGHRFSLMIGEQEARRSHFTRRKGVSYRAPFKCL